MERFGSLTRSRIELDVIDRLNHRTDRPRLDPLEALIVQLEREALSETRGAGFQPAVNAITIAHTYFTGGGQMRTVAEHFHTQNTPYIHNAIRQQLRQYKHNLTIGQIRWYLERVITPVFEAAETRFGTTPFGMPKPEDMPKLPGVTYNREKRRWKAQRRVGQRVEFLGYHDTPREAYEAYRRALIN